MGGAVIDIGYLLAPWTCPGCRALGGDPCAPWCLDGEIVLEEIGCGSERGDEDHYRDEVEG